MGNKVQVIFTFELKDHGEAPGQKKTHGKYYGISYRTGWNYRTEREGASGTARRLCCNSEGSLPRRYATYCGRNGTRCKSIGL